MIAQLSVAERQLALVVLGLLALAGLAMTVGGAVNGDLIAIHGLIVLIFAAVLMFVVGQGYYAPEPSPARLAQYYDDPTKVGIVLAMIWAVIGMFVGVWVAALLAWPELTFVDQAWASFGRIRPVHTSGVIFGFGGNALIATSYHVVQRTSRARLPGQFSPWFVLLGFNLFCILAASGYLMGITQNKEYAEPEWYADIWLTMKGQQLNFEVPADRALVSAFVTACAKLGATGIGAAPGRGFAGVECEIVRHLSVSAFADRCHNHGGG